MSWRRQESLLVFITMIWGGTFLVTRIGVGQAGPFGFLLVRFATGVTVLGLLNLRRWRSFTRDEIRTGVLLGLVLFASYGLQTSGLRSIPSGKSAFITSLYVPIVPLLQWAGLGRPPRPAAWAGVALASVGLVGLSLQPGMTVSFGWGEAQTLISTVAIALEILLIGRWSPGLDPRRWAVCQMATVAALSALGLLATGEAAPRLGAVPLACAVGLGLATGAIQVGMNWAQQSVSPTRATLIYALEPVWAGLIGRCVGGETLTTPNVAGAALIVAGVLVGELWPTAPEDDPRAPAGPPG